MKRYSKNEMVQEEIKHFISTKNGTIYKILILDIEESLPNTIFKFLKRTHQVIGTHREKNNNNTIKLDLSNIEQLKSYIEFYNPSMIIVSSRTIGRLNKEQKKKLCCFFIELKQKKMVRIIYLNQDSIVENKKEEYVIKGKREYLLEEILELEEDTIFYIPEFYGGHESTEKLNMNSSLVFIDEIVKGIEILLEEAGRILLLPDCFHRIQKQLVECDEKKETILVFPLKINISEGLRIIEHQSKCSFNLVYKYNELDSYQVHNIADLRFLFGRKLAENISSELKEKIDYVCPVPKTGLYYAMGLAIELHVPYIQALIKTNQQVRSFEIQDADARKELLWDKIKPLQSMIKGKKIAVVDEAIFTGTTLKVVCQMLRECEVAEIHLCIPTPKCRYHCEYDMLPERPMLLEYINDAMLHDYFDVDSITFQTDEDFMELLKPFGTMCTSCFFGNDVE